MAVGRINAAATAKGLSDTIQTIKLFNPLTAVSAYLRKAEGPSQNNSLKINRSFKNPET